MVTTYKKSDTVLCTGSTKLRKAWSLPLRTSEIEETDT